MLNFVASTSLLSSAHTGQMLGVLLNLLHLHLARVALVHHFLRKLGHFTAYAILGGLLFRAWRVTLPQRYPATSPGARAAGRGPQILVEPLWTLRWSALAWGTALLAGGFDELHQSFVPSRGASVRDVALDAMGALFLQLVLMVVLLGKTRPADAPRQGNS